MATSYKTDVQCHHVGNDDEALMYIALKMLNANNLIRVWDTHVRIEDRPDEYRQETYDYYRKALTHFITDHNARLDLIVGHKIDHKYIEVIKVATEKNSDSITCFRLREPWPLMNFAVLEYSDGKGGLFKEVLFGWGRLDKANSSEAVFRCEDARLVAEFANILTILEKPIISQITSVASLLDKPYILSNTGSGVEIRQKWDYSKVLTMLLESEHSADIKIIITFFVPASHLLDILDELLIDSERKMEILMMSPDDEKLLESRYGKEDRELRSGFTWKSAAKEILNQMESLDRYRNKLKGHEGKKGSLDVRIYDSMPTQVFYRIGNDLLVGSLLTRRTFDAGPMISVTKDTDLWRIYEEEWDFCWELSKPFRFRDGKRIS